MIILLIIAANGLAPESRKNLLKYIVFSFAGIRICRTSGEEYKHEFIEEEKIRR